MGEEAEEPSPTASPRYTSLDCSRRLRASQEKMREEQRKSTTEVVNARTSWDKEHHRIFNVQQTEITHKKNRGQKHCSCGNDSLRI